MDTRESGEYWRSYVIDVYYAGKTHSIAGRDSQRSRVYKAEDAYEDYPWRRDRIILTDPSEAQVQAIVTGITSSDLWEQIISDSHIPRYFVNVQFIDGSRSVKATSFPDEISLPPWARTMNTILHELAHSAGPVDVDHQWIFCAIHLRLVREFMGQHHYEILRGSYRLHGVRYLEKHRPTSTW